MQLTRRAAVAAELARAGDGGVSGEALAALLGVSRVAIGKHVAALRGLGYVIEGRPHVGYRLVSAPDLCLPEEVAPRLTDALWVACDGGRVTGSTNDDAKRLARAGAPEGTLVVAAEQTAGRGRFGRTWSSPAAGAYLSAVLRPPVAPRHVGPLALALSVGIADALAGLGVEARLKWPNDVVTGRGKLAGILLEMTGEADTVEWVVVGCGLNVGDPTTPGSDYVRSWAPGVGVGEAAAAVLDGLARAYGIYVREGFVALADTYRERCVLTGHRVIVRDSLGSVVADGVVETIDDSGALLVGSAEGVRAVTAGEVTLREG